MHIKRFFLQIEKMSSYSSAGFIPVINIPHNMENKLKSIQKIEQNYQLTTGARLLLIRL